MQLSRSELKSAIGKGLTFTDHGEGYLLCYSEDFRPKAKDSDELFQIFDQSDDPVVVENRKLLFYRGQCHGPKRIIPFFHRGVNILFEREGSLYLPKRASDKDLYPSCHEFSVGEHVKISESYEDAAVRGCQEELGQIVAKEDLKLFSQRPVIDAQQSEQVAYFTLKFGGGEIRYSSEIDSARWVSISEVKKNLESLNFRPDHLSAFREIINNFGV